MGVCCARDNDISATASSDDVQETMTQKADSMQEVLDRIYMGSAVAAKNKQLLIDNGVTHIIAIGWNLEKYFEDTFQYLLINRIEDSPECVILSQFQQCFEFMDDCLNNDVDNKLFVHCHKGLSRSASICIAYEMRRKQTDFDTVLHKIREKRSFIMPNIGFQAQLHEFQRQQYSLDMDRYSEFDVLHFIQQELPKMLQRITFNYNAYKSDPDKVEEDELFELTLYTHQVHLLKQKDKLNANDIQILKDSIKILRKIQVEFVQIESSIKRFDIMFKDTESVDKKPKNKQNLIADNTKAFGSVPSSSVSALNPEKQQSVEAVDLALEQDQKAGNPNPQTPDENFSDDPQLSESQKLIAT